MATIKYRIYYLEKYSKEVKQIVIINLMIFIKLFIYLTKSRIRIYFYYIYKKFLSIKKKRQTMKVYQFLLFTSLTFHDIKASIIYKKIYKIINILQMMRI